MVLDGAQVHVNLYQQSVAAAVCLCHAAPVGVLLQHIENAAGSSKEPRCCQFKSVLLLCHKGVWHLDLLCHKGI